MQYSAKINISNKELIAYVFGVVALAIGAQLSIPLRPVPISLQTFVVMYIGIIYSKRCALSTVMTYVGFGALGLPLFTNYQGGMEILLSPRGGYIVGFVFAVVVMNHVREYIKQSFLGIFVTCLVGSVMLFICGLGWLSTFVGVDQAIQLGLLPFIIPGLAKAFLLTAAIRYTKGTPDSSK